ncbi:hypothetical protein RRG08_060459 [Elysia crispata]|uniref:Uncharacterized protein n=1 Tax=Elysia crispata TaxID=231223 RepID=A0AAE1E865_9GAST|nr:hypothetical protein RRG08_060459 [Elysia crispata]
MSYMRAVPVICNPDRLKVGSVSQSIFHASPIELPAREQRSGVRHPSGPPLDGKRPPVASKRGEVELPGIRHLVVRAT